MTKMAFIMGNMLREILYIKRGNRETIVGTSQKEIHLLKNLEQVLDDLCLDELTTFKGRYEAIQKKYHLRKMVPIFINPEIMFFPTKNKKDFDNLYLNAFKILRMEQEETSHNTIITFKDYSKIVIEVDLIDIQNNYHKCLKLYQKIS